MTGETGDGEGGSEGAGTPTGILEAIPVGVGNPARGAESGRISALHSDVLRPLHLCRCAWGSEAGAGATRQGRANVLPRRHFFVTTTERPLANFSVASGQQGGDGRSRAGAGGQHRKRHTYLKGGL